MNFDDIRPLSPQELADEIAKEQAPLDSELVDDAPDTDDIIENGEELEEMDASGVEWVDDEDEE